MLAIILCQECTVTIVVPLFLGREIVHCCCPATSKWRMSVMWNMLLRSGWYSKSQTQPNKLGELCVGVWCVGVCSMYTCTCWYNHV